MQNSTQSMADEDLRKASLETARLVIKSLHLPIALVGSGGDILFANDSWERDPTIPADNIRPAARQLTSNRTAGDARTEAAQFGRALDEVLAGRRDSCELILDHPAQSSIRATRVGLQEVAALIAVSPGSPSEPQTPSEEAASDWVAIAEFRLDLGGRILDWSPEAKDLFERGEQETVGQHVAVLLAGQSTRFPNPELIANLREHEDREIELRFKKNQDEFFDGLLTLSMVDRAADAGIACRVSVLSERRRTAGALRRSDERLRYALEAVSDGLWDWDLRSDLIAFSPRFAEIFGRISDTEDGDSTNTATWESHIHPEDADQWRVRLHAHLEGRTPELESEHRIRTETGEWKWVLVRGRVTETDASSKPRRLVGTITDISERKIAQEALRCSEQQYRNLFEFASDAVVLSDFETGCIRDANEKAHLMLGYPSDALRKMTIRDLHPPDQWNRVESAFTQARSGQSSLFEVDGLTRDGRHIPLEVNTRLVGYGNEHVYQSFIRDVSERRLLAQQLRQSQKMETVGRLAGGVAHDFNNLLTAIQGYTTLLKPALPEGGEEREMAEEVLAAVRRASRLTMQLLTFSRHEIPNPAALDVNSIVVEMEDMLQRLIGEHIELQTSLCLTLGEVEGDRGGIEQVLTNLVVNAADAMPDGGTLRIQTEHVRIDSNPSSQSSELAQGDYVLLSVQDEGQGMDSETLSQIFEPFFTTKAPGIGTGLGLSTVYGIVKQNRGHMTVESEPGKGTLFRIYLPISQSPIRTHVIDIPMHSASPGEETVLVVEDEPSVRHLTCRFLEASGYTVVEAEDAPDAIRLAEREPDAIDLLLTDVIMPEISGPELANRLRGRMPRLKVLYMSGYPGDFIARHGVSDTETPYLHKPFTHEVLTRKLREVLDS